jgi:hypothetical protein
MFDELNTLMGYTLAEVREILDRELEPAAYSPVPSGADLTDIKPAWLTETLNRVFGMAGVGWAFSFAPEHMRVTTDTDRKGRTVYHAVLKHLSLRYRVVVNDELVWSEPIPANGGSDNYDEAYATRGALTNALGAAASKIGWQISIYQGKRSHHTVQANVDPADIRLTFGKHNGETLGNVPEGYLGWLADNANEASLRNAAKRLLGQSKRKKTKTQKPAPQASGNGASGNGNNGNGADQGMPLAHAKAVELPFKTRSHPEYQGKTLGELEQIEPELLDLLVEHGRVPTVMEAAAVIVAARA